MDIYIRRGEEQFGPFTPQQVEESLASGALMETDYAWHSELTEWVPVRDSLTPAKPAAVAPSVPAAAPTVQAIEAPKVWNRMRRPRIHRLPAAAAKRF